MAQATMLKCVLDFLRTENRIEKYLALKQGPYFLAIQGIQGSGKTTLAKRIADTLRSPPWSLPTIVISVDDFYLTHKDQTELARENPHNPLIQHRGQASTHDIGLWKKTFESLKAEKPTAIPQYDKSCFNGEGDRVDAARWEMVNEKELIKVVIFEGWNVGFQSLPEDKVKSKWEEARQALHDQGDKYNGQLGYHRLEDLLFINNALREEEQFQKYFQDFVQIYASLWNVYRWRLQQETALRNSSGSGMTDESVKKFIDGYFPSYELYTETLLQANWRRAVQTDWKPQQVRIQIGDERDVMDCLIWI